MKNLKNKTSRARAHTGIDSVSSSLAAGKRNNYSSFLSLSLARLVTLLSVPFPLSLPLSIGVYRLARDARTKEFIKKTPTSNLPRRAEISLARPLIEILQRKRQLSKASKCVRYLSPWASQALSGLLSVATYSILISFSLFAALSCKYILCSVTVSI